MRYVRKRRFQSNETAKIMKKNKKIEHDSREKKTIQFLCEFSSVRTHMQYNHQDIGW